MVILSGLPASLIDPYSLIGVLSTVAAVLEEPGIRTGRGDVAARILIDSIFRLYASGNFEIASLNNLKQSLQNYIGARAAVANLVINEEARKQYYDVSNLMSCR